MVFCLRASLSGCPSVTLLATSALSVGCNDVPSAALSSSYFVQKISFDTPCKLSSEEIICMKCQSLFSEKNKEDISKCHPLIILPMSSVHFMENIFIKQQLKGN